MNKSDIVLKVQQQFVTKHIVQFLLIILLFYSDYEDKILFNEIGYYIGFGLIILWLYVFMLFYVNRILVTKDYLIINYPLGLKRKRILLDNINSIKFKHTLYFLRLYVFYEKDNAEFGEYFTVLGISNKSLKKLKMYFDKHKK